MQNPTYALRFLLLSSALGLAACATIPDQNLDPAKNNRASYRKNLSECKQDWPEAGSGVHIRQWESCMNLKGWR